MALNDIYTTPSVDSVKKKKRQSIKKGMSGGCNCYLSRLRVLKKQNKTKQLIFNKKMYCDIYTVTFLHLIDIARNLRHTCCLCITGF